MKTSEMKEAVAKFMENDYWKRYLEKAPSDKCKEYIKYSFYYSTIDDDDDDIEEVVGVMNRLEDEMSLADWKHLYKYASGPFKGICKEKISELSE